MRLEDMTFEDLKKVRKGYYASFDKLHSINDFEVHLNQFLNAGAYFYNGQVIEAKQLVNRINSIKIEIYPNEHPPPHFHIKSNGMKASLAIKDCSLLENSGFSNKTIKRVRDWFEYSKDKLIKVWNTTRPDDCVVGKIS